MRNLNQSCITLSAWRDLFRADLQKGVEHLRQHVAGLDASESVWISLISPEVLETELARIATLPVDAPLRGVPFAVKDNIDVAAWPTTAACREFTYMASADAGVIARLRAAGAIVIGKTNLDQFATGLVGTRSPWGPVANAFNPEYVSGGSSSGSAVAVAKGYVAFALGTDTAGSGRVPAGFNNLIGLKPTRGRLSTRGVVPACASLDCVSILAMTIDDATAVLHTATGYDANDIWSRPAPASSAVSPQVFGIPDQSEWHGDQLQADAWQIALEKARAAGLQLIPLDFSPLYELASLLYSGPWVAERTVAVGDFIDQHPGVANPVVEGIIRGGTQFSAVDTFKAQYQRQGLLRKIAAIFAQVDALLVPTTPAFPTIAEVEADPVGKNAQLGRYTNFVNLADLCALALPAGFRADGLPFGITLIAPAFQDEALLAFARQWQDLMPWKLGISDIPAPVSESMVPATAQDGAITVAVVGAHLRGQPLNHQLLSLGATFLESTYTAANYRLFALKDSVPPKPGLIRCDQAVREAGIEVELWSLNDTGLGQFMRGIPVPLGIGTITLRDGRHVKGFICEGIAQNDAKDITHLGGWRAYLRTLPANNNESDHG